MDADSENDASKDKEDLVVFEYIKSSYFRVIHSSGAIGGITPEGNLHFALFSDRPAIPKMQVYSLNSDGTLGSAIAEKTIVRPGIIREMDVDVVMNSAAARTLAEWILARLSDLEGMARN